MTAIDARPRGGAFARLLRAPWFVIVAGVVAVAVLVTAGILFVAKFDPFATAANSEHAPSAFPTSLTAVSSPLVKRGGTVSLSVQSAAPDGVDRVELWDGDRLYYQVENPPVVSGLVSLAVDFVPTVAGSHVLSVRTVAKNGQVSLSDPVVLPVLDLASDLGLAPAADSVKTNPDTGVVTTASAPFTPFVTMSSSIGDTLDSIALRLSVQASDLLANGITGLDSAALLDAGTRVSSPLADRDLAREAGYGLVDVSEWTTGITGSVTDCAVTISLDGGTETMALYATSPVQPGYIRIGDVTASTPWTSATMPIGPTMYVAYRIGATSSDTSGDNQPTAPLYLSVPNSCAEKGWSGDARVVNGALTTDFAVENPYAYISVDQGEWIRVPSTQGQYLTSGSINDIRASLTLAQFDQVDLEVWTFDGTNSAKAAAGQFCRKNIPNASAATDSGSTGTYSECRPTSVSPGGDTSLARTGSLSVSFDDANLANLDGVAAPVLGAFVDALGLQPSSSTTRYLESNEPVTVHAVLENSDANRVIFQYSFFPLATTTTALSPPGVVATQEVTLSSIVGEPSGSTRRQASTTFYPWKWRDARITEADSTSFDGNGNNLELDDELALLLANAQLAAGKNIIDTLYVRAIAATDQYYGPSKPIGVGSSSLVIDMHDYASYPMIEGAKITLESGLDVTATDGALRHKCFAPLLYPDANDFDLYPYNAPVYDQFGALVKDQSGYSDLDYAQADFPDPNGIVCLDPESDEYNAKIKASMEANANDCSLDCYIFAAFVGAVVGFAAGGPVGALFGAAAGAALAYGNPGLAGAIYAAAKQYWDLVAQVYNTVMDGIISTISKLNPVCLVLGEAGEKDSQAACEAITGIAAQATVTALTGLPPTLPLSDAVVELAKGEFQALIVVGIDYLLGSAGISCDTFTISDPSAVWLVQKAGNELGSNEGAAIIASSEDEGTLNGCKALANLIVGAAEKQYSDTYGSYIENAMEKQMVPNMIAEPVADSAPTIAVAAPTGEGVKRGDTCPVTANVTITKSYLVPDSGQTEAVPYEFQLVPLTANLVANGGPNEPLSWEGQIVIPILPYQQGVVPQLLLTPAVKSTNPSASFLHFYVDSPCFASTYEYSATEFPAGSGTSTFVIDTRSFRYYYGLP
jgi:hypothetical protein